MTSRRRVVGFLALAVIAGLALGPGAGANEGGAGEGEGSGGATGVDPSIQVGIIVARANERFEPCRNPDLPDRDQIECVARVLDGVADDLHRTTGMRREQRIFRSTASAVRQSSTRSQAVSAVEEGRRELLRSDGAGRAQARALAEVMDTARSVLRS